MIREPHDADPQGLREVPQPQTLVTLGPIDRPMTGEIVKNVFGVLVLIGLGWLFLTYGVDHSLPASLR